MLLGRRFTHTSWPLQRAHIGLVAGAVALYFASYVFRALGWQKLFPAAVASRSRAAASPPAAPPRRAARCCPFRLDYLVKIGTLRRMRGVKLGLEAIALSIISLGLVDAIAFLPLSISATATSSSSFRFPLTLVVLFGVGACGLLVGGRTSGACRSSRAARASRSSPRASPTTRAGPTREQIAAWFFLLGCWTSRALGQHAAARRARRRLLADARARRPLPRRRRLADPDRLGRRDRQRQRDRGGPARARRPQGAGDQLRPRLRPAALRHGRRRRARRRGDLARLWTSRAGCSPARRPNRSRRARRRGR